MGCGGDDTVKTNEVRFVAPLRRILDSSGDVQVPEIGRNIQPVIVVADLSYAAGTPQWRGDVHADTVTGVAAKRGCFLFGALGGPVTVDFLQSVNDIGLIMGPYAGLKACLGATYATIKPWFTQSGEPRDNGLGASTIAVGKGSAADADLPPTVVVTGVNRFTLSLWDATPTWLWPPGFKIEIPRQWGLIMIGTADNTDQSMHCKLTEHKDWG